MFNRWSRWSLARGIEVVSTHHLGMAISRMHMSYQSIIIYIYIYDYICISQISDIYVLVDTNYIQHSLYSAPHYPNIPTTTISIKHQQMYLQLWQRHQQVLLSSVQGIPKDIAMAVEGQPILTSHVEPQTLGTLKSEHSGKNPNSYRCCGVDLGVLTNRTSKEVSLKHVSLESEVDLKFVSIQAFQLSQVALVCLYFYQFHTLG